MTYPCICPYCYRHFGNYLHEATSWQDASPSFEGQIFARGRNGEQLLGTLHACEEPLPDPHDGLGPYAIPYYSVLFHDPTGGRVDDAEPDRSTD